MLENQVMAAADPNEQIPTLELSIVMPCLNEAEKKLRNLIRNAKRNFEKKLAKSHGNSKPFYAYLKKKTTTRAAVGPLRGPDNSVVTDSKGMAGILNKFFSSVFSEEGAEQSINNILS